MNKEFRLKKASKLAELSENLSIRLESTPWGTRLENSDIENKLKNRAPESLWEEAYCNKKSWLDWLNDIYERTSAVIANIRIVIEASNNHELEQENLAKYQEILNKLREEHDTLAEQKATFASVFNACINLHRTGSSDFAKPLWRIFYKRDGIHSPLIDIKKLIARTTILANTTIQAAATNIFDKEDKASSGAGDMRRIVIIAAMEEELGYFFESWGALYEWSDWAQSSSYWMYRLSSPREGYEVIATHATGLGLSDSASVATSAIDIFHPDLLIMLGICAGKKKKGLNIGDIIIARNSFHYQFGSFENGNISKRLLSESASKPILTSIQKFGSALLASQIWTERPSGIKDPDRPLKIHFGSMASADLVVKDSTKLKEAEEADEKVIALDMESYAVLRVASFTETRAIVIKSVTDFADAEKDDDYREYAKYTSGEFCSRFLTKSYIPQTASSDENP